MNMALIEIKQNEVGFYWQYADESFPAEGPFHTCSHAKWDAEVCHPDEEIEVIEVHQSLTPSNR